MKVASGDAIVAQLTSIILTVTLSSLQGCIELLDRSGVVIEGKEAVVLGRSNIVGKR